MKRARQGVELAPRDAKLMKEILIVEPD